MRGYRLLGEGAIISSSALGRLSEPKAVIFDCDGTLIETTRSYGLAIRLTPTILMREACGVEVTLGPEVEEAVTALRLLGGFNNDWDTASAIFQSISLHSLLHGIHPKLKKLGEIDVEDYLGSATSSKSSPNYVADALKWIIEKCEKLRGGYAGLSEIERMLQDYAYEKGVEEGFLELRRRLELDKPMSYGSNLIATLFDEIYLGESGVREKYGVEPTHIRWRGAVVDEEILVSRETLRELSEIFRGRLGLVTGRGRWETWRTLETLRHYFNSEACVFIADYGNPEYEKPSPKPLLDSAKALKADSVIYVGDSAEDLQMSRNAEKEGLQVLFAAVASSDKQLQYFLGNGADIILDDVNLLLKALEVTNAWWM